MQIQTMEQACISCIENARKQNRSGRIAIAVDGRSAAGKSTLAALLAGHFDAPIVHMDDFFLPDELRTDARRREAGGNVHYERFLSEVAPFLKAGGAFSYGKFDCGVRRITGDVEIKAGSVVLIEGAYALHPLLQRLYAAGMFVTVDAQTQRRRILKRNGEAMLERFLNEWIPLEEAYIETYQIPARCDLVIDTTE